MGVVRVRWAISTLWTLENFATASRWYTGDIHNSSVVGLFMTPIGQWKRLDRVMVECTCLLHIALLKPSNFITSIDLFRTCRTSSFCTVAWQLARFQLTRRIARSLGDSGASCWNGYSHTVIILSRPTQTDHNVATCRGLWITSYYTDGILGVMDRPICWWVTRLFFHFSPVTLHVCLAQLFSA